MAIIGAAATVMLWESLRPLAWLTATVIVHFFLFCNVFRVRRSLELAWSALFLINVAAFAIGGRLDGALILLVQLPVTVAVIVTEIRSARYHGVLASQRSRPAD